MKTPHSNGTLVNCPLRYSAGIHFLWHGQGCNCSQWAFWQRVWIQITDTVAPTLELITDIAQALFFVFPVLNQIFLRSPVDDCIWLRKVFLP